MATQKKLQKQYALPKSFWIILTITLTIMLVSLGWLLFWRTGWPDYLEALNKCNGRNPVVASSFITSTYTKPGDKSYKIPVANGIIENIYYCTEDEAISAGYKHITQ